MDDENISKLGFGIIPKAKHRFFDYSKWQDYREKRLEVFRESDELIKKLRGNKFNFLVDCYLPGSEHKDALADKVAAVICDWLYYSEPWGPSRVVMGINFVQLQDDIVKLIKENCAIETTEKGEP